MMPAVSIVGGGFAAVWTAAAAARRRVQAASELDITVVAPGDEMAIRPRLYESRPEQMRVPLRRVLEPIGVRHVRATAVDVDVDGGRVLTVDTSGRRGCERFDRLVIAAGSRLAPPVGVPGAGRFHDVDTLPAALALDRHLHALPARAAERRSLHGRGRRRGVRGARDRDRARRPAAGDRRAARRGRRGPRRARRARGRRRTGARAGAATGDRGGPRRPGRAAASGHHRPRVRRLRRSPCPTARPSPPSRRSGRPACGRARSRSACRRPATAWAAWRWTATCASPGCEPCSPPETPPRRRSPPTAGKRPPGLPVRPPARQGRGPQRRVGPARPAAGRLPARPVRHLPRPRRRGRRLHRGLRPDRPRDGRRGEGHQAQDQPGAHLPDARRRRADPRPRRPRRAVPAAPAGGLEARGMTARRGAAARRQPGDRARIDRGIQRRKLIIVEFCDRTLEHVSPLRPGGRARADRPPAGRCARLAQRRACPPRRRGRRQVRAARRGARASRRHGRALLQRRRVRGGAAVRRAPPARPPAAVADRRAAARSRRGRCAARSGCRPAGASIASWSRWRYSACSPTRRRSARCSASSTTRTGWTRPPPRRSRSSPAAWRPSGWRSCSPAATATRATSRRRRCPSCPWTA